MGKFRLEITDLAKKQIASHIKFGNKASIKKIEKILLELTQYPFEGVGNPKQLKQNLNGFWSRRINENDCLIYSVDDDMVLVDVITAMGHYSDK